MEVCFNDGCGTKPLLIWCARPDDCTATKMSRLAHAWSSPALLLCMCVPAISLLCSPYVNENFVVLC